MATSIASLIDLDDFLAKVWCKSVEVIAREAVLISAEDSFSATVSHVRQAAADCGRAGAPGVRFYLDGHNISTSREVRRFLPTEHDASWTAYSERVEALGGGRDWCLIINDPPRYTPLFDATCATFFQPLLEEVGVPLRQYSTELFVGRYGRTPFEIHTDPGLESFYCVLQGSKRLWFWEPDHWTRRDFDYPPALDRLSPDDRGAATIHALEAGDLLYWPADYWHIGETPSFAVSLGVSLIRPTPQQAGNRLRQLVLAALRRVAEPCVAEPYLPMASREPWKLVPADLLTEASRIRNAAQWLEDEVQSFWLTLCTNRGSFDSMAPGSEMYPSVDEIADPTWDVALEPNVVLAWRRDCHGTLVVSARGARWDCVDAPEIIALLQRLRAGDTVSLPECLRSLPESDPSVLDQSDVLHLVASMFSAKVLGRRPSASPRALLDQTGS